MGLRPDENGIGHVKAESASHVDQEVIAADEVRASAERTAIVKKWLVKSETFQTDSALQFRLCPLAERRAIDRVEIVEDRTVGVEKNVHVLMGTPGHLRAYPKVFLIEKEITAERRITTAADALWSVVLYVVEVIRRRLSSHRAHAKCQIKLLSVRCAYAQQNQTKGRTQKE